MDGKQDGNAAGCMLSKEGRPVHWHVLALWLPGSALALLPALEPLREHAPVPPDSGRELPPAVPPAPLRTLQCQEQPPIQLCTSDAAKHTSR